MNAVKGKEFNAGMDARMIHGYKTEYEELKDDQKLKNPGGNSHSLNQNPKKVQSQIPPLRRWPLPKPNKCLLNRIEN